MSNQGDFMGRVKGNWQRRASERSTFGAELRVIPRWLVWTLCALYGVALAVAAYFSLIVPDALLKPLVGEPPVLRLLAMFGIVTAAAAGVSLFVLFYGYIGGDAKRRGMSPVLWVLVALLVPYLIGAILYFVVREPLPLTCPKCGLEVNPHFNFCPGCKFNLRPTCPQCRRALLSGDRFCPHCGFTLQPGAAVDNGAQAV